MLQRIAVLALLGISLASAKTYTITLSDSCHAGGTQLQPGQYTVKLEGSKIILIDRKGRNIEAPARVEAADRKYDRTAVTISRADGTSRLREITFAGSRSRVIFE